MPRVVRKLEVETYNNVIDRTVVISVAAPDRHSYNIPDDALRNMSAEALSRVRFKFAMAYARSSYDLIGKVLGISR